MKRTIQRFFFFFALFLTIPLIAAAQQGTVEGTVIDGDTDESLPGVQVFIPDLGAGAVTSTDGTYTITGVSAGPYTIEARFVGFRTVRREVEVSAGETVTVDFTLTPSSIDLNEVVVAEGQFADIPVVSAREMHLILAEAALGGNADVDFTTQINAVRSLDGITEYNGQVDALDLLISERCALPCAPNSVRGRTGRGLCKALSRTAFRTLA